MGLNEEAALDDGRSDFDISVRKSIVVPKVKDLQKEVVWLLGDEVVVDSHGEQRGVRKLLKGFDCNVSAFFEESVLSSLNCEAELSGRNGQMDTVEGKAYREAGIVHRNLDSDVLHHGQMAGYPSRGEDHPVPMARHD